jgi:hypothetical protein
MAKLPIKQMYSTPLNNIAVSMMFLLPGYLAVFPHLK